MACESGRFTGKIPCAGEEHSIVEAGIVLRPAAGRAPVVEQEVAHPRLVDCAAGYIESLLVTVPTDLHSGNEPHLEALISALGPETNYVLLHNRENAEAVARWQAAHGIPDARWLPVVTPFELDIWAQDPYVAMQTSGEDQDVSVLGEGVQFRSSGMIVADEVTAGLAELEGPPMRAFQSFLFFEGGNVLATPSRVLVGKDHLARNLGRPGLPNEQRVGEAFARLFGNGRQEILPVGLDRPIEAADRWGDALTGYFQPIFHLDMHVTPTGMVGNSGREVLLFGTPTAAADVAAPPPDFRLQPAFDKVEASLKRHFEVHRLPLLPVAGQAGAPNWPLERYYLTWNNVLIESWDNDEGGVARYVFMPVYGPGAEAAGLNAEVRHALDELAEQTWSDLGFEVRRLTSMEDLAYAGGAAHCISKTLRRGPAPRD